MTQILKLEEVYKVGGVPTHTFVEPEEYARLKVALRTPGRGVVVEGPSGIGKTTAIERALDALGLAKDVPRLSPRRKEDVEYIEHLPTLGNVGAVIVDDFQKLSDASRAALADYLKALADEERAGVKLILVGINNAGQHLIHFAQDLVNRIDIIRFESNPNNKVEELLTKGEAALNISLNVRDDVVKAARGSFYLAQMLAHAVCIKAGILETQLDKHTTAVSFEGVKAEVWDRLALSFRPRCERFCRGAKMKSAGRAPYLHILRWLAQSGEWLISLPHAMRANPDLKGSVGQVVEKGYLAGIVNGDDELRAVLHYDEHSRQLIVEDPQFLFFLRNVPWKQFAADIGFLSLDFQSQYDFALSFAGPNRAVALAIAEALREHEVEVFYDHYEQHRILAEDVEEYLRPIYNSEAQFVIPLLSQDFPKRIWTKFESDAFRERFKSGAVIPVWYSDAPPGMFDESRKYGGLTYDPTGDMDAQASSLADLLVRKLGEARASTAAG